MRSTCATAGFPTCSRAASPFFDKAEIKDITSYLRLLANSDDDPAFIRAVTTPKRGVGGSTLEALGKYAGERHLSLFAAAFEEGFAHRVQPRQLGPLLEFCQFINRFEYRAAKEPAGQVIGDPACGDRLRILAVRRGGATRRADALG